VGNPPAACRRGADTNNPVRDWSNTGCDRCGGRMKLIAVLTDPNTIEAVTASLEEDANPLEPRPASPPPDDPMSDFDGPPTQGEDVQLLNIAQPR